MLWNVWAHTEEQGHRSSAFSACLNCRLCLSPQEKSLRCTTAPALAAQFSFHSQKSIACGSMVHTHMSQHWDWTQGCTLTDQDWGALQSIMPLGKAPELLFGPSSFKGESTWFKYGAARSGISTGWKKQAREGQRRGWTKQNQDIGILDAEGKTVFSTGLESDENRYWWPRFPSLDEKIKE